MSAMGVEKIYREPTPERNPGSGSNPVDLRRDARRRNTVPRRKRQSVDTTGDQNPFHETTDEVFANQYQNHNRYINDTSNKINRVERTYAPANDNQPIRQRSSVPLVQREKKVKHKPAKAKVIAARLRVSAINGWVIGWSIAWYLSFQWWMGLLSLAGLGMAAAVYSNITQNAAGAYLLPVIGGLVSSNIDIAVAIGDWALSLFGFEFNPLFIFIVPTSILLLLGLLFLLSIVAIYSASGVKSLTGEKAGLKIVTFIIALISSATPLPMVFLWLGVVWKNPK